MTEASSVKEFRTATFPQPKVEECSPFELSFPSNWQIDTSTSEYVVVVYDPVPRDFRSNLTVGVDLIPRKVNLNEVDQSSLADAQDSFIAYRLEKQFSVNVAGRDTRARLQSFFVPEIEDRVVQLQILLLGPQTNNEKSELFQIHATCLENQQDKYLDTFQGIAQSLSFRK